MDHYPSFLPHLRLCKKVDDLEREHEAAEQNALQELQKAKNEIEQSKLEDEKMFQEIPGGTIPPRFKKFIEDKRDFRLREATQNYEETLANARKRFIEETAAINEKWRGLRFALEELVGEVCFPPH